MRTAIDTNVVSALWSREATAGALAHALAKAKLDGGLVLSGVVFAELLAHPLLSEASLHEFLGRTGITIDFPLDAQVWTEAGLRFGRSSTRRRRGDVSAGPRRLIADFVIGSHALFHADRLMTLDGGYFATDFPELRLFPLLNAKGAS